MRPKYNPNAVNKKPYDSTVRRDLIEYSVLYYTVHTIITQHSDNIRTDEILLLVIPLLLLLVY